MPKSVVVPKVNVACRVDPVLSPLCLAGVSGVLFIEGKVKVACMGTSSQRSLCLLFRGVSNGVKSRQQPALLHISLINGVDPEMTNRKKAVNSKRKGTAKRVQLARRSTRKQTKKTAIVSTMRAMAPARGALQVLPAARSTYIGRGIPTHLLSMCAAKYFASIAAPWSPEAQGACIPDGNSRESHKVTGFIRFSAATGTSGVGWVLAMPSLSNDAPCICYTTATYAGNVIDPFVVTAGVVTLRSGWAIANCTNLPYDTAPLLPSVAVNSVGNATLAGRIVSVGISVEPTMRVMDMGGITVCYATADHANLNSRSFGDIQSFAAADIKRVDIDKCFLVDFGHNARECSYSDVSPFAADIGQTSVGPTYTGMIYPFSNGLPAVNGTGNSIAGFSLTAPIAAGYGAITQVIGLSSGSSTTSVTFQSEYIIHAEYVGVRAQSSVTPTHRDPVGFGHVQEAAAKAPQIKQSKRVSWSESMMQGLKEVAREYGPTMLKEGAKVLAGLLL